MKSVIIEIFFFFFYKLLLYFLASEVQDCVIWGLCKGLILERLLSLQNLLVLLANLRFRHLKPVSQL